jgi:hypothetical protein
MHTPHFVKKAPIFYSMAAFCMLFADIRLYVGRSDLLGIIPCGEKRLVSSSLCVAQFRAGALLTAVLTFVLMQDGFTSVLFSGVFRTAIATVRVW